jgi:hypothetical protein
MRSIERVAMFLGAGASKAFSAPITSEILPIIIDRARQSALFGNEENDQRLMLLSLLRELMPGIEAIDQRYVLITEVLSLIDYMLLSAFVPAPMAKAEQLHTCRMLLERAILEVLTGIVDRTDDTATSPELRRLAKWMYEVGNSASFSLVSTNYDEIIESELYKCFIREGQALPNNGGMDKRRPFDHVNYKVNFGISWRDCPTGRIYNPPPGYKHSVLKLHGSVDWVKCDLCGWIVCNDEYFFQKQPYHVASYEKPSVHNTCNCGHWPLRPVVIAPSLVRDIRDINIRTVWKSAFEELRTSDRWFIIGYSLPIDDYAIRSMIIRALKSRRTPPKIEVYQWGNNPETKARYQAFFGTSCEYHPEGMQGFIARVVDADLGR